MTPFALDLAERLLTYNPAQRIDAIQAMACPYFFEEPNAAPPVG
jgi:CTD kinase subunit alpha